MRSKTIAPQLSTNCSEVYWVVAFGDVAMVDSYRLVGIVGAIKEMMVTVMYLLGWEDAKFIVAM